MGRLAITCMVSFYFLGFFMNSLGQLYPSMRPSVGCMLDSVTAIISQVTSQTGEAGGRGRGRGSKMNFVGILKAEKCQTDKPQGLIILDQPGRFHVISTHAIFKVVT